MTLTGGPAPDVAAAPSGHSDPQHIRILVVDDQPEARKILVRILHKRGYEAEAAADVAAASSLLAENRFDLVMTDLDMPDVSGLKLIEALSKLSPQVATILVTGCGSTEVASEALTAGAYGYISKPFLADEVYINVLNALRRRQLELESLERRELLEKAVRDRTFELAASLVELHTAQQALRDEADQIKALDAMKTQFIQVVSHELRTPLTVIKGGVQTVLRYGDTTDPTVKQELLESVERNADQLGRMVQKILAVATIGQGSVKMSRERFPLDEVVMGAVEEAAAEQGRVRLSIQQATALGDSDMVKDVARDIIENALLHTQGTVVVSTQEVDGFAVLSVTDEGPAPTQKLLARILAEPFVQGDSTTTRPAGGLGLSVYLAKRLVEASDGRFTVSASGLGSTFSIALPLGDHDVDR